MYKLKLRTEGREKFPLARVELGKEFDILQTAVVHISAENSHRDIECVPDQHDHGAEHISYGTARDEIQPDPVELLRDNHARKHKPEQARIAEHVRQKVDNAVNGAEPFREFTEEFFLSPRGQHGDEQARAQHDHPGQSHRSRKNFLRFQQREYRNIP